MSRPKGSKNKVDEGTEIHTDSPFGNHIPLTPTGLRAVIDEWIEDGTACKYVRFKDVPVSPAQGKEPVWEFKLDPKTKYSVDSMVYHHEGGVVFTAHGEQCVVAPGNVGYWRPL